MVRAYYVVRGGVVCVDVMLDMVCVCGMYKVSRSDKLLKYHELLEMMDEKRIVQWNETKKEMN